MFTQKSINNCQKLKTTLIHLKWWVDKQTGISIQCNTIQPFKKKEQANNMYYTCVNLDIMMSERNQPQKTSYYDSTYMTFWKIQNCRNGKHWLPEIDNKKC